ncbi:arrestin domain-containing protein 3-like [Symphorus nematophorus]
MFQQTIQNFDIHLNALNERGTFFSGQMVTGNISFELKKMTKITSITMELKGKVHVHWRSGTGKRRRYYSAKLELFNLRGVILQENRAVQPGSSTLHPGTHVYPFTCQIPQGDFPSTFRGVHGAITYSLTVGINRPWHLSKDFVTELNFVSPINTNQPELWAPLAGSNTMTVCCLCWASGPITVSARTEKKAFIPGETVKIICDFSNASSRTATPKVKLHQNQVFYTLNHVTKREFCKTLVSVTGQLISAHTSDEHAEIMLTIPSDASPTISNCSILNVNYKIEMSLSVSGSTDLTVLFPIILYEPLPNTHPPQNLPNEANYR